MVREIDALGGEMGRLIDATMIQFRVLNRSRGPAVQAPRAQADKLAYQVAAKSHARDADEPRALPGYGDRAILRLADPAMSDRRTRPNAAGVIHREEDGRDHRYLPQRPKIYIGEYTASAGTDRRAGRARARPLAARDRFPDGAAEDRARRRASTAIRSTCEKMQEQFGDEEVLPFSFSHHRVERRSSRATSPSRTSARTGSSREHAPLVRSTPGRSWVTARATARP